MEEGIFLSEPGKTEFEIKDGLVVITCWSGSRCFQRGTTINAFKRELRAAQKLIDKFDAGQKQVVVKMR